MSEFDDNNVNCGQEENDESIKPEKTENENKNDGVVFNSDGTYHGKAASYEEASNSATQNYYENASSSGNVNNRAGADSYPYGRAYPYTGASQNQYNDYTSRANNSQSQNSNPYSAGNNQYPYNNRPSNGNTQNPYSNNNSSYPYGNNGAYQGVNQTNGGYAYSPTPSNDGKKKKGGKIFAGVVAGLCVFLVISLVVILAGGDKPSSNSDEESTTTALNQNAEEFITSASPETGNTVSEGELTPKNIFKKVLNSSVGILVYDKSKTLASEGSGVLFQESSDGKYTYIITCAHVINDASGVIRVQLSDGKEYDAAVVGFDSRTDIGVIRIEKTGLTLADIGDSSKISVGDPIYAIGNPGGVEFANSFTNGMVSALDRPVNSSATGYTTECIQHTAAINPGNSGGALVNSFGQVIGINSMKIVADDYEGMGFAVPSSVFVEIVNEIMAHGYVSNRPKLGITYVAASEYSTYGMFVAIKGLPSGSIVIYEIGKDSGLAGTEAKAGDMIVAVNGNPLETPSYLSEVIEESNVGDKLTLTLVRIHDDYSSEEFKVTATLVEDRGDTVIAEEETQPQLPGNSGSGDYYGDYFGQFFEDYFNEYFGGRMP